MKRSWDVWVLGVASALTVAASAQAVSDDSRSALTSVYDGRYTFVRLHYTAYLDPFACTVEDGSGGYGWRHDYPRAEQSLMRALTVLSTFDAPTDTTLTLRVDDPALLRYPIAYLSEPGSSACSSK